MDELNVEPQVVEAEVVESTREEAAQSVMSLEVAIKERIEKIEDLKAEMQPVKEMLASYLENDKVYMEHDKAAKAAAKQKSATKKQLLSIPAGRSIVEKLDAMKVDLNDLQEGLSYYLREFQMKTGANEIEGLDGELRQIVYVAKLVRKTNLNR